MPRKQRACRRCRRRKQHCDYQEPACRNCVTAGVPCLPAIIEKVKKYPVSYVEALEQRAAGLESQHESLSTPVSDEIYNLPAQYQYTPGFDNSLTANEFMQWQLPLSPSGLMAAGPFQENPWNLNQPVDSGASNNPENRSTQNFTDDALTHALTATRGSAPFARNVTITGGEILPESAASFFRTYFEFIHPRYPFLDVKECGDWYVGWKAAPLQQPLTGWPAFFVKMIFAVGSIIQQSKADRNKRGQDQDLKAQAQAEQEIITDTRSSPLTRLRAMLLTAMHALHGESTPRIAHISCIIMRFASIQGFHRLVDDGQPETKAKIKAWTCAYLIDRVVSGTLDIPVSLSDSYISSPVYTEQPEPEYAMPWLLDAQDLRLHDQHQFPIKLNTFAHMCRIRVIQSKILNFMQSDYLRETSSDDWENGVLQEIDEWSHTEVSRTRSQLETEGMLSPLWLRYVSALSKLLLCRPNKQNIETPLVDIGLQAACEVCSIFRTVQKSRQVTEPWLMMISQFQTGVTILYIIWARHISLPKEADRAIRDCTSVMAILADRSQSVENYRDCLDILAQAVSEGSPTGYIEPETKAKIGVLIGRLEDTGIAPYVSTMLWEMCAPEEEEVSQL